MYKNQTYYAMGLICVQFISVTKIFYGGGGGGGQTLHVD